ncbi:MAG TPA: enoyl-CoA hydratase-related protein, partial [Acidimicrobiales bacterium]
TAAALDAAAVDDEVAVVVITGAGRAFSAGQDLLEMAELAAGMATADPATTEVATTDPGGNGSAVSGFPGLLDALQGFPKPLMAAVNGLGLGIGFTLLAHCDLVLIAEGARLKTPFTSLGVAPEAASSVLFPIRMGWQQAARVLFTSDWISATEAVELGVALRVCPPETMLDEALELAGRIAAMPISSLVVTKRLMLDAQLPLVIEARRREDAAFATVMGGPANLEALTAFAEKRPPDFTGVDDRPPPVP